MVGPKTEIEVFTEDQDIFCFSQIMEANKKDDECAVNGSIWKRPMSPNTTPYVTEKQKFIELDTPTNTS